EQRLEIRLREFNDHLLRAQAASQRERHDEAIREYSAALRLQPGDPTALLGRAHARKARMGDTGCPRRAINDLLLLGTYDPRGTWVEQRQLVVEWMGLCGSSYAARRLELARELAAEPPGSPGRPDEIRVTVAELLHHGAGEGQTASETEELRKAALEELE